jgi:hypothetical protein
MIQVWTAWLLLAGLIIFEVKNAFAELRRHKEAWMLAVHCVLLTVIGMLVVQAGVMILDLRFADRSISERLAALKVRIQTSRVPAPRKAKQR